MAGLSFLCLSAGAQQLTQTQLDNFGKREDSLKGFAYNIVNGETATQRFVSDSQFIRMLVRTLKQPNSFYYPFDSLETISRLYAPDSTFRIFTWQFKKDTFSICRKARSR